MLCLFTNIWRVNWKELWEGTVDNSSCKKSSKQKSFLVCSIPHFSNGMHTRNRDSCMQCLKHAICIMNTSTKNPGACTMQETGPKMFQTDEKALWRSTQHFWLFEQSYVIIMEVFVLGIHWMCKWWGQLACNIAAAFSNLLIIVKATLEAKES